MEVNSEKANCHFWQSKLIMMCKQTNRQTNRQTSKQSKANETERDKTGQDHRYLMVGEIASAT